MAVAQAQTYPDKPIRVIVSIAAGSVTDVIVRAAAEELKAVGQPLVIENVGGAAGILAGQSCAQSAPGEGYTLCVIYHSTMSLRPVQFDQAALQRRRNSCRCRGCS